jgi:hypothetical protein
MLGSSRARPRGAGGLGGWSGGDLDRARGTATMGKSISAVHALAMQSLGFVKWNPEFLRSSEDGNAVPTFRALAAYPKDAKPNETRDDKVDGDRGQLQGEDIVGKVIQRFPP